MAIGAAEFDEVLSTTIQSITPTLKDNVFRKRPGLDALRTHITSGSGTALIVNLIGADGGETILSDDSGTFVTAADDDVVGIAKFEWSSFIMDKVRIKAKQLAMNSGVDGVTKLVKAHLIAVQGRQAEYLNKGLYKHADQLTSGDFLSLDALVGNAASDDAAVTGGGRLNVGGIDSSVNSYWQATRRTSSKGTEDIQIALRELSNDIQEKTGERKTHILLCGRSVFSEYESSLDESVRRMMEVQAKTDTRFQALYFDGDLIVWDPDCDTDRLYMIDPESFEGEYLEGHFMKSNPSQTLPGTLDQATPFSTILALGVNERRANGLLIRTA